MSYENNHFDFNRDPCLSCLFGVCSRRTLQLDKTVDFSTFKTYKWVTLQDAAKLDDITAKNIKAAVDSQLASKGLTKVDTDNADLFVAIQAAVGQEQQFTPTAAAGDMGRDGMAAAGMDPEARQRQQGRHRQSTKANSPSTFTVRRNIKISKTVYCFEGYLAQLVTAAYEDTAHSSVRSLHLQRRLSRTAMYCRTFLINSGAALE